MNMSMPGSIGDGFLCHAARSKKNAVTTFGALSAADFTYTIAGTHVSVMPPGGMTALSNWMASYENANTHPHELTLLLYGITY